MVVAISFVLYFLDFNTISLDFIYHILNKRFFKIAF